MLFIAEIGMNHNGNLDLCNELVRQAKWAGADIAKFQLGWRAAPGEINHITPEDLIKIENICKYYEIEYMASIITEEGFALSQHTDPSRYKIASRTVIDKPDLVKSILKLGKPTFLSLGMWEEEELPFTDFDNITYLWCKSLYPTYPWDLTDLPKSFFDTPMSGYSDHSVGIEIALTAIARGAGIVEKHFTLDKSDTTIRDHSLSATPDEFRTMVNLGRNIHKNNLIGV
jgi:N,N'-diacetyllegionaminate synthase